MNFSFRALVAVGAAVVSASAAAAEKTAPKFSAEISTRNADIQWVAIPGGKYMMGDDTNPEWKPRHEVSIQPFMIAKSPVTVAQYKACMDAGVCQAPDSGCNLAAPGRENHPINCVDWLDASQFAAWVGGRLPSEAEWEYAARGAGREQKFPWGDEGPTCDRAATKACGAEGTSPVCSKPAGNTRQGVCDLGGNVWEWIEDGARPNYEGAPVDGSPWSGWSSERVARGGSWAHPADRAGVSYRESAGWHTRASTVGFRPVLGPASAAGASVGNQAAPPVLAPGKAGIQWVKIPGGAFTMGFDKPVDDSRKDEVPAHRVTIKTFELSKSLVTNKQYSECVSAGACTAAHIADGSCDVLHNPSGWWTPDNLPASFQGADQPAVCLTWDQAKKFASWVGGRLPTESEWEFAARSGGKDQTYPWGNEDATCERAAVWGCGYARTLPICSRPAGNTAQGLCDMTGNVAEWLEDGMTRSYEGAPSDGSAAQGVKIFRAVRGVDWSHGAGFAEIARRSSATANVPGSTIGFRVAR